MKKRVGAEGFRIIEAWLRHEALKDIVDAAGVSSESATLELATDMPIRMDFELPQGKLVYYLAPCIGA